MSDSSGHDEDQSSPQSAASAFRKMMRMSTFVTTTTAAAAAAAVAVMTQRQRQRQQQRSRLLALATTASTSSIRSSGSNNHGHNHNPAWHMTWFVGAAAIAAGASMAWWWIHQRQSQQPHPKHDRDLVDDKEHDTTMCRSRSNGTATTPTSLDSAPMIEQTVQGPKATTTMTTTTAAGSGGNKGQDMHLSSTHNSTWQSTSSTTTTETTPPAAAAASIAAAAAAVPAGLTTVHEEALERIFQATAERIQQAPTTATSHWTAADRLLLYALFKQATIGNASPSSTSSVLSTWTANPIVARAKWQAWNDVRGMDRASAQVQYILVASELLDDDKALMKEYDHPQQQQQQPAAVASQAPDVHPNTTEWSSIVADAHQKQVTLRGAMQLTKDGNEDDIDLTMEFASRVVGAAKAVSSLAHGDIDDDDDENIHNNDHNGNEMDVLFRAARRGDVEQLKRLLDSTTTSGTTASISSLNVHTKDNTGQTALHFAADAGHVAAVEWLLQQHGADVNAADDMDGISILQTAVMAEQVDVVRLLLFKYNANPDQADHDGETPRNCLFDDNDDDDEDVEKDDSQSKALQPTPRQQMREIFREYDKRQKQH